MMKKDFEKLFEEVKGSSAKFKEALEAYGRTLDQIEPITDFKKEYKVFYTLDLKLMKQENKRKVLLKEMEAKGMQVVLRVSEGSSLSQLK